MIKPALLIVLLIAMVDSAKAQNWGGGIDDHRFNWGFGFQYISSELKLTKTRNWRQSYPNATDSLTAISSPPSAGFGLGFVFNANIAKNFDFRFTPTLVFTDRVIAYHYVIPATLNPGISTLKKKIQATMVDIPLALKIKSDRLMNFRAYMLAGLKCSLNLTSGRKANDLAVGLIDKLIKNKKNFLSYEAGFGFDLYFEYFKLSPEVKLSYSFKDILMHEDSRLANPIDKAKLRHFTFSLFFE